MFIFLRTGVLLPAGPFPAAAAAQESRTNIKYKPADPRKAGPPVFVFLRAEDPVLATYRRICHKSPHKTEEILVVWLKICVSLATVLILCVETVKI